MRMQRIVETNQRMYFDLDRQAHPLWYTLLSHTFTPSVGQYLVSGNHNGCVSIWDTRQTTDDVVNTSLSFLAHQDCVNGIR